MSTVAKEDGPRQVEPGDRTKRPAAGPGNEQSRDVAGAAPPADGAGAANSDAIVKPGSDRPVPRLVRRDAWLLEAATGQPGEVIHLGERRWRLVLANTRMSYAIEYAPKSRQRLTRSRQTFLIDGDRAQVHHLSEIAQAYHDADEFGFFPRTSPTPMPPGRELEHAPVNVRVQHDLYTSRHGVELDVGFSDESGWVSGADLSPGSHIRFFFSIDNNGNWLPDPRYIAQLVTDGWDRSSAAAGELARIARRLAKDTPAAPAPDGDSTAEAAAGPARNVSTEVHDTVVLRI